MRRLKVTGFRARFVSPWVFAFIGFCFYKDLLILALANTRIRKNRFSLAAKRLLLNYSFPHFVGFKGEVRL